MNLVKELEHMGINHPGNLYYNLSVSKLVSSSLSRREGILAENGALSVLTGAYTGRSPDDRFIVQSAVVNDKIDWGELNRTIPRSKFTALYNRLTAYLQQRDLFIFDGFVGADSQFQMPIRFINEFAWQSLFAHQLFIKQADDQLGGFQPQFTLISAPGFRADPQIDGTRSEAFIIIDFETRRVIIGGTHYAGEMKKSIFSVMNYLMPQRNVLPMHCSANVGSQGDVALFFGLSGTGKTTLSVDPDRRLIGDDEHGWSDHGIFNFEGGCYAKCINLSKEKEPQIWEAIKFGTVVENVVVDQNTGEVNYDADQFTENTRAGYPLDYIPGVVEPSLSGHPQTVVFLTADAFGVLPPVAVLTEEQAMYYFLSGYTSKLAGTERGIKEPRATFSACFGAPFLPLSPMIYATMLGERMRKHGTRVFLVNTGWSGGPYGVGQRINLNHTRAILKAALSGNLEQVHHKHDAIFKLHIPQVCPDVPPEILNPQNTWANQEEYDIMARKLAQLFTQNFTRFSDVSDLIKSVGPAAIDL